MSRSPITCHVLDAAQGRPAASVSVALHSLNQDATVLATGSTNADGRCPDLLPVSTKITGGTYKMVFETGAYFASQKCESFYPRVEIPSTPDAHYHIPLLLSPFSYTTYRGS